MPEIGTILHSWGEIGCTFAQSAKSIILSVFVKLASFSERLPSVVENPAWSCEPFLSFSRLKRFHYSSIGVAFDRRMKCITASRYHPLKHHSLTFLSTLYPNVTLWTNKTPLFLPHSCWECSYHTNAFLLASSPLYTTRHGRSAERV